MQPTEKDIINGAIEDYNAAAGLLGLRVRISPRMNVSCEYCVSSGRGVCTGLISPPEESN
jgi:hypothetical protein